MRYVYAIFKIMIYFLIKDFIFWASIQKYEKIQKKSENSLISNRKRKWYWKLRKRKLQRADAKGINNIGYPTENSW